jgi:opacity protein-like surface antigen
MMKLAAVLAVLIALSAAPLKAQDEPSRPDEPAKFEAYGGYDYLRFNSHSNVEGQPPSQSYSLSAIAVQLEYNFSHRFGLVGDVAGYRVTSPGSGDALSYLFGPRYTLRRGRFTPFAHALFGGFLTSSGIQTTGTQTHFALATGAGIDIRVTPHISIRPLQAEYFMTTIPDGLTNRQNNFRFGFGVSYHFNRFRL